jgi:Fe-Mn family superoxide dismutase
MFTLPPLPYALDALEPIISKETLEYHYGKHHQAYIDKLNTLITGTEFEHQSLEEIVKTSPAGTIYNNAAQALNHQLYWNQLQSPTEHNQPQGILLDTITNKRGNFEQFQAAFETSAVNNFGSGRTRLVKNADETLEIINTSNAGNPLTEGKTPLLTVDIREHAYYIDYRNRRADYLKNFWKIINWTYITNQ